MAKMEIVVGGMSCEMCQSAVQEVLSDVEGVTEAAVDLEGGRATVVFDEGVTNLDALRAAVEDAGFDVE
ncbi:MAG: heavy-metal-associated domain-containing protein [Nitrospinae bacterium]|nr:heavy-metal-associated domain-containing protein [Nitrospinota bacterium]